MTRISAGIPPIMLCDQMLIAEHREIVRIPNMIKSGKAKLDNIPEDFRLGTGHVKFFYNKLSFLHNRYVHLYAECISRRFAVQDYSDSFNDLILDDKYIDLWKSFYQTLDEGILVMNRVNERLRSMKVIRYKGIDMTYDQAKIEKFNLDVYK